MSQLFQRFSGFTASIRQRASQVISSVLSRQSATPQPLVDESEDEVLTLIRQEHFDLIRSNPLQNITTRNGVIRFEQVPGRIDQLSLAPNEWATAHVSLVDNRGRTVELSFYGATGRQMREGDIQKSILSRLWDTYGDNVEGTGLRPSEWLKTATFQIQAYRTTFVRSR